METLLEIRDLSKQFNKKSVLNSVSFDIRKGEFLSILGSSGCGKTTLLRILIGIEKMTSGNIYKGDVVLNDVHPSLRNMGIVFQNYSLFPNMTVLDNVMYALNAKIKNKEMAKAESLKILDKVGMSENINKKPHQLSGGQQQRVAIARTLVLNPDIILFDEPLSALDSDNRLNLRKEFKRIQKEFNVTMIYVTHDQEEAFSLSDRVMVMSEGNIEQLGTPQEIYHHPANDYVRSFVKEHLDDKVRLIEDNIKVN